MRYYTLSDPETVNLIPLTPPSLTPKFDVTPHGLVVTISNTYATYTWNSYDSVPAMYHHALNTSLTFTGSLMETILSPVIIEWYWIFGDGSTAIGQTATHTYTILSPEVFCHLRVTDNQGTKAYASMNMLLTT